METVKDLDFDELDKAVSSLMAGVKKSESDPAAQSTPVTPPADESPSETVTVSSGPATPAPRPSLAAKRTSGRFMDVMHPSARKKPEAPRPASRQGVAVEPLNPSVAPEPITTPAPEPEKPELKDEPAPTSSHAGTSDWPDPLDFAPSTSKSQEPVETPEPVSVVTLPTEKEEPKEKPAAPQEKPEDVPPLTSPFLPDTKVEKRPLGANAAAAPSSSVITANDDLVVVDEEDQLPAMPKDVASVLPEELHGDVMAIESDTTTQKTAEKSDAVEPVTPAAPESAPSVDKASEVKHTEEPKIVGPTSIAQQYREEPSSGDQKNGAIYDTDDYHQPVAHPAKKKSGWMLVVWILLILIVGVAVGATLYMLKIV